VYPVAVRTPVACLVLCACLQAGTQPKPSAAEYATSGKGAYVSLGAELLGRAVDSGTASFFTASYIVVEAAVFPRDNPGLPVSPSQFRLRINGATRELSTAAAGAVAADIRNPEYSGDHAPGLDGAVSAGGVVVATRRQAERFPGDPTVRRPGGQTTSSDQPTSADRGSQAAVELALEAGPGGTARSGLLYFHWKGKLKDLKKIELVYDGPGGLTVLRLR
jgi:hypothetical protein